ncbi:hypothetical protein B0O99DRAFT_749062 [Bisporella sp. PMI_857]|nr:hypothetical protein B0O99DRAFT_749062 [Bisporella sp. PMI_857]
MAEKQSDLTSTRLSRLLGGPHPAKSTATAVANCSHNIAHGDPPSHHFILTYINRFRLKLCENHGLTDSLRGLPHPSFRAYLKGLADFKFSNGGGSLSRGRQAFLEGPSEFAKFCENHLGGHRYPETFDVFLVVAGKAGHNALVERLLQEVVFFTPGTTLYGNASPHETLAKCIDSAVKASQLSTVQLLLSFGAKKLWDVNLFDPDYPHFLQRRVAKTTLDLAVLARNEQILRLLFKLLSRKIFWAKGNKLSTALAEAAEHDHLCTFKLLLQLGAKIPNKPTSFPNVMNGAAKGGNEEIFKLLREKGGKGSYSGYSKEITRDQTLMYCFRIAVSKRHHGIVKMLLDGGYIITGSEELNGQLEGSVRRAKTWSNFGFWHRGLKQETQTSRMN